MNFRLRTEILDIKKVCSSQQTNTHRLSVCDSCSSSCSAPISYICLQAAAALSRSDCFPLRLFLDTLEAWRTSIQEAEWPCCAEAQRYVKRTEVLERDTPGCRTRCDGVQVRQRNEWIIEEFTPQWDIAALVKAGSCCYTMTGSIN